MTQTRRHPSGRPQDGEFAAYAKADIDQVPGDDAVEALASCRRATLELFEPLDDDRVRGLTYAPGKWTLKEVLGHLVDDERIFAYRALCIARGDERPLAGFDENLYARHAGFEERPLADLLAEYRSVRDASISLFAGLPADAWHRRGLVDAYPATVRGLAFHIAGHELHHHRVLASQYLGLVETAAKRER